MQKALLRLLKVPELVLHRISQDNCSLCRLNLVLSQLHPLVDSPIRRQLEGAIISNTCVHWFFAQDVEVCSLIDDILVEDMLREQLFTLLFSHAVLAGAFQNVYLQLFPLFMHQEFALELSVLQG